MLLLSQSIDIVRQKMISGPKNATWLGHDIQNSIISLLAESLRWKIREKFHTARYFTIIADETKDISKSEQLFLFIGMFLMATHMRDSFPIQIVLN